MQDYTPVQYMVIKALYKCKKTILGDFGQCVNPYNSNSLSLLSDIFENSEIVKLNKSYRSTYEIIKFSEQILKQDIEPIERHGDKVQHWKVDSENNKIIKICEIIKKQLEVGHINIAIITKDFNESLELHKEIINYGVNVELISENLDKYTGGVIVIPSYLSKGLEFDSVIISDFNKYSENMLDTKLMYVACTRAMHTLDIIKVTKD